MHKLRTVLAATALTALAHAPLAAQAQTASPAPAPAPAPMAASVVSSFDGYRVLAVTAGIIGGAALAAVVTDGLIIPVYAWAIGSQSGGWSMAGGMAAGAGAGASEMVLASGGETMFGAIGHAGYQAFRGTMTVLGAVGGGFYADSRYAGG